MPAQPDYPGRLVRRGHPDEATVRRLQNRLNAVGIQPPVEVDGDFGRDTERAVKLFQARAVSPDGVPLSIDGEVGAITWAALFGADTVPEATEAPAGLLARTLAIAAGEVGTMEQPLGSNDGPEVRQYLAAVGLAGRYAWCAAFVYWCVREAAEREGLGNPLPRTGGVLKMWADAGKSGIRRVTGADAYARPSLVKPGYVFVMDYGRGMGHTGFVETVAAGKLTTIEGNTNEGGSRNGVGVFRRASRTVKSVNKGFLAYA